MSVVECSFFLKMFFTLGHLDLVYLPRPFTNLRLSASSHLIYSSLVRGLNCPLVVPPQYRSCHRFKLEVDNMTYHVDLRELHHSTRLPGDYDYAFRLGGQDGWLVHGPSEGLALPSGVGVMALTLSSLCARGRELSILEERLQALEATAGVLRTRVGELLRAPASCRLKGRVHRLREEGERLSMTLHDIPRAPDRG